MDVEHYKISEHETTATIVMPLGSCYYKLAQAELLTFYDDKIAYVVDIKVLESVVDVEPTTTYKSKMYDYMFDRLKPPGIDELRCDLLPILDSFHPAIAMDCNTLEIYLLMRVIRRNVVERARLDELDDAMGELLPTDLLQRIVESDRVDSDLGCLLKARPSSIEFWVNLVPDPRDKLGCVGGIFSKSPFSQLPPDQWFDAPPSWERVEISKDYETSRFVSMGYYE